MKPVELSAVLFPKGTSFRSGERLSVLLEQYKLFVETSEQLVARRQSVNTFFLTANALLLSVVGLLVKESVTAVLGVISIGVAGNLLCWAWMRLVSSYRQLNAGKFLIIHQLEQHLPAALFRAEWVALGEGKDKHTYTPFTKTGVTIPVIFMALYALAILVSLIYLLRGWLG